MSLFEQASTLNPALLDARLSLLQLRSKDGQLLEFETELKAIVAQRPDWHPALFYLANLKLHTGRPKEGLELFRQALDKNQAVAEAHWRYSAALLSQGQPEEALGRLQIAVKRFPDSPELLDLLATAQASTGHFQEALTWGTRALEAAQKAGRQELARTISNHLDELGSGRIP
jgi:tetratricopeptide (TPR) repeat protein